MKAWFNHGLDASSVPPKASCIIFVASRVQSYTYL